MLARSAGTTIAVGDESLEASGRRWWLVGTEDQPDDAFPEEKSLVRKAERQLRQLAPKADPEWIRDSGRNRFRRDAKHGDTFVVICNEQGGRKPYEVSPPSSLLLRQHNAKWTRFYYDPDLAFPLKPVPWERFRRLLKKAGYTTAISSWSTKIIPTKVALELQQLWPRKRVR